jgi:hypothetical protein
MVVVYPSKVEPIKPVTTCTVFFWFLKNTRIFSSVSFFNTLAFPKPESVLTRFLASKKAASILLAVKINARRLAQSLSPKLMTKSRLRVDISPNKEIPSRIFIN